MRIVIERHSCFTQWHWKLIGSNNKPVCVSVKKFIEKWMARQSAKRFCKAMGLVVEIKEGSQNEKLRKL